MWGLSVFCGFEFSISLSHSRDVLDVEEPHPTSASTLFQKDNILVYLLNSCKNHATMNTTAIIMMISLFDSFYFCSSFLAHFPLQDI